MYTTCWNILHMWHMWHMWQWVMIDTYQASDATAVSLTCGQPLVWQGTCGQVHVARYMWQDTCVVWWKDEKS